jgi:hypothetical protein
MNIIQKYCISNHRLRKERDDALAELARIRDPEIKHLRMENGAFDLAVGGELVKHLALVITEWFRASAENYVEMTLDSKVEPFETYAVTVQRVDKKTPHQFRQEAEDKYAELLARYQSLCAALDKQNGTPCEQIRHEQVMEDIRDTLLPFWRADHRHPDINDAEWGSLDNLYMKYQFPRIEAE